MLERSIWHVVGPWDDILAPITLSLNIIYSPCGKGSAKEKHKAEMFRRRKEKGKDIQ